MSESPGVPVAKKQVPIEEVLRASRLRRVPGAFAVARCGEVRGSERHLLVARDELETTVITRPELLADCEVLELNADRWALLAIDCASPFYCVGFLARLTATLAAENIDVLALSTFTRDSLLVPERDAERAMAALLAVGLQS